jgi:hypothetical protein
MVHPKWTWQGALQRRGAVQPRHDGGQKPGCRKGSRISPFSSLGAGTLARIAGFQRGAARVNAGVAAGAAGGLAAPAAVAASARRRQTSRDDGRFGFMRTLLSVNMSIVAYRGISCPDLSR